MLLSIAIAAVVVLGVYPLRAESSIAEEIQNQFQHKVLTLRGLYRGEKLEFAADGKLLNHSEVSFGPADALFSLDTAEQKQGKIVLTGDLPVIYYSGGNATFTRGVVKRVVEIALPEPTMDAAMTSFWKVFLKAEERAAPACAPNDDALLHAAHKELLSPAAACLFTGERGFGWVLSKEGGKVTPPRATYDPEPEFPEEAREKKLQGTEVLSLVVDPQGRASAVMVTRSLGHGFDALAVQAVRSWRFDPAKRNGEPVAVLINVEINFHLNQ
ncbi:MAG TPA: energy transducer TonB [Candidatus Koribacter sp.]|jgi:TonB family protein